MGARPRWRRRALLAAGCGGSDSGGGGGSSSSDVEQADQIGASLPLTGDFSEPGKAAQQGYQVWQKMVNAAGRPARPQGPDRRRATTRATRTRSSPTTTR